MKLRLLLLAAACCWCSAAMAKVVTKPIEYSHDGKALEGIVAYDDAVQGKRPGVLVIHEWWGRNDFAVGKAKELAAMGYVAFALDMYGKGTLLTDAKDAAAMSGKFKGQSIIRTRAKAGLDVLAAHELVDKSKLAAIGFCFGGTTAMELAYSGADLKGIVSFHGGLVPVDDDDKPKARLLILHGADDPHVPQLQVLQFEEAARKAKLDWQLVSYGGAQHSFTNPEADKRNLAGSKYHEPTAKRSWQHMKVFFDEIFK